MMVRRSQRLVILVVLTLLAVATWTIPFFIRQNAQAQDLGGPPGRSRLEVCIELADGASVSSDVVDQVTAAFQEVKKHPDFTKAGLDRGDGPNIIRDCPSDSTLVSKEPHVVTEPSPIFTFIFLATEEELAEMTFKRYPRVTSQETICEGDACHEVTKALYITPKELDNTELLVQALTSGIGLLLPGEDQPIYVDGVTPDDKSK